MEKEYDWLSHVRRYIQITYPTSLTSPWAAYHTSRRAESNLLHRSMAAVPTCRGGQLPMDLCHVAALVLFKHLYNMPTQVKVL